MGAMLWAQKIQQQPTTTSISQARRRKFYIDWELAALMGYAQFYTEYGIPIIWGEYQISKECDDNRQELLAGMMYWSKTNLIEIDTVVLFVKLANEEMVKTKFNPGGPVAMY